MIMSRLVLPGTRKFADKNCKENLNTHFMFKDFFENRAVYQIM